MKKLLLSLLLLLPLLARADNASNLMGLGMPGPLAGYIGQCIGDGTLEYYGNPYTIKAGTGAGTVNVQSLNNASTSAKFGRTVDNEFQSLVEIRNQTGLSGSGNELGRGAIRLIDTVGSVGEPDGRTMELGYYAYGGGIFTNSLFEFFTSGVSIRRFGDTSAFLDIRDDTDSIEIRIWHNNTDGVIETNNTGTAGSIVFKPNRTESWRVSQTSGDFTGHATGGGNLVINKSGSTISLQEGTPSTACMGVATPNGNSNVAVSSTCATSGARVIYSRKGAITNMGVISTTADPSGTGFSFASTGASDTLASSVVYMIVKES